MSYYAKSREEALAHYKVCIKAQFAISDEHAEKLAERLYDQLEAHGANPDNLSGAEESVEVIVGAWIKNGL